jgi:DNA-binding MarR family transcriptional regulator
VKGWILKVGTAFEETSTIHMRESLALMATAPERLFCLQRHILTWLVAEDQRTRGTMAASHQDLVHAVGGDKGNVSTSLKGLERKGLIRIHRTSGGHAEAVDLTAEGRNRVVPLAASCE